MAKNNKADMSCARVKQYAASDVSKAERHNERKNETYENMNVIAERYHQHAENKIFGAVGASAAVGAEYSRRVPENGQLRVGVSVTA